LKEETCHVFESEWQKKILNFAPVVVNMQKSICIENPVSKQAKLSPATANPVDTRKVMPKS
jgi:hypothetical protein